MTVVDAGVVIALLDGNDHHHAAARRAVDAARMRGDQLVLPASAYSEALVNPSRAGQAAIDVVNGVVDGLPMVVQPVDRSVAAEAAMLRAAHGRSLRLPDALVLATALGVRADRILTTDARLPAVGPTLDLVGSS